MRSPLTFALGESIQTRTTADLRPSNPFRGRPAASGTFAGDSNNFRNLQISNAIECSLEEFPEVPPLLKEKAHRTVAEHRRTIEIVAPDQNCQAGGGRLDNKAIRILARRKSADTIRSYRAVQGQRKPRGQFAADFFRGCQV